MSIARAAAARSKRGSTPRATACSGRTKSAAPSTCATARPGRPVVQGLEGLRGLVVVEFGGRIYISSDSGASWTARESDRDWRSVAYSADGSKLVAASRARRGLRGRRAPVGANRCRGRRERPVHKGRRACRPAGACGTGESRKGHWRHRCHRPERPRRPGDPRHRHLPAARLTHANLLLNASHPHAAALTTSWTPAASPTWPAAPRHCGTRRAFRGCTW